MRRKRYRRSRYQQRGRNSRVKLNFTPVIVILCLSIGCGYAAAKYVVDPVVNYVPQLTSGKVQSDEMEKNKEADDTEKNKTKKSEVIEDAADVQEKGDITGYALQFGCYSSKAAAEATMPSLGISGLQVVEQNNMYKIVGEIYKTKDEAKAALEELPDTVNSFVTAIYE